METRRVANKKRHVINRHRPTTTTTIPDARRARTRAEAIEAAHESSRTSPTLRLCFALANRAATQEEAAALFVAALRGLGCEARTCVALTPVPLRASAASLERAGILLRSPRSCGPWTASREAKTKSQRQIREPETETIKAKCKAKAKAKAKIETEGAPSAETNAIPTRFAEPVTHWAEVLCRDEGGEVTHWARGSPSCPTPRAAAANRTSDGPSGVDARPWTTPGWSPRAATRR